jgi:hypothetical protein
MISCDLHQAGRQRSTSIDRIGYSDQGVKIGRKGYAECSVTEPDDGVANLFQIAARAPRRQERQEFNSLLGALGVLGAMKFVAENAGLI